MRGRRTRPVKRAVIPLVAGAGVGMTLTITGLSNEDVARARRRAQAGHVDDPLVMQIVATLIEATGVRITAYDWSSDEYMALLDMLGMAPSQWTARDERSLEQLLADMTGGGRE